MPVTMGDQSADRVAPSMLPSPPMSAAWGKSGGSIWAAAPLGSLHSASMAELSPQALYYAPAPLDEPQSAFAAAPMQQQQRGNGYAQQYPARQLAMPVLSLREQAEPARPEPVRVLIQRLSPTTSVAELRIMLVFSQDLLSVQLIGPHYSEAEPQCSALLLFGSMNGATEACNKLNNRPNPSGRGTMIVGIVSSPAYGPPAPASSGVPNGAPNGFADFSYGNHDAQPLLSNGVVSPTAKAGRFFPAAAPAPAPSHHQDLAAPDTQAGSRYREMFNRQSPNDNYLPNEVPGRLGKHLINDELGDEDDRELLRDSVAYGHRGTPVQRRDDTITPPDSVGQAMAALSLDPSICLRPAAMPAYLAGLPSVNGPNDIYVRLQQHIMRQQQQLHHPQHHPSDKHDRRSTRHKQQSPYGRSNYPPVNPADQNPPCNTLYVGNLPMDACEDELKIIFSFTRGYKRMCFRIKHNGPMCFVEYEDIAHATKALTTLYGFELHNSVKGGIRLSFSKNPLGVRSASAQPPHGNLYPSGGMRTPAANGFAAASGPPPGLPRPPGLGSRSASTFSGSSRAGSAMGAARNGSAMGNRNGSVSGGASEAGPGYSQRQPFHKGNVNYMGNMSNMNPMYPVNGMNAMNAMHGTSHMNNMHGMHGMGMAKSHTPVA
ncbi:hypothetical protein J3F83DRAFT_714260 [Trichoderma novae-zelandiae]